MKPASTAEMAGKENIADYQKVSWRATWKAIIDLPTDHFPLLLPGVHSMAAFFILKRLKRLGYSNCKVQVTSKGLVIHAHR